MLSSAQFFKTLKAIQTHFQSNNSSTWCKQYFNPHSYTLNFSVPHLKTVYQHVSGRRPIKKPEGITRGFKRSHVCGNEWSRMSFVRGNGNEISRGRVWGPPTEATRASSSIPPPPTCISSSFRVAFPSITSATACCQSFSFLACIFAPLPCGEHTQ